MAKIHKKNNAAVNSSGGSGDSAMRSWRAHLCLWLTAIVGFAADLGSKWWILKKLGDPSQGGQIVIIDDYLRFITAFNSGAAFGVAAGKTGFLIVASVLALGVLTWFFATTRANQHTSHIAIGMLLAGALGNMYDRITNNGFVVDFIDVNLHFWPANPWPTFNIADIAICLGVALMLSAVLLDGRSRSSSAS